MVSSPLWIASPSARNDETSEAFFIVFTFCFTSLRKSRPNWSTLTARHCEGSARSNPEKLCFFFRWHLALCGLLRLRLAMTNLRSFFLGLHFMLHVIAKAPTILNHSCTSLRGLCPKQSRKIIILFSMAPNPLWIASPPARNDEPPKLLSKYSLFASRHSINSGHIEALLRYVIARALPEAIQMSYYYFRLLLNTLWIASPPARNDEIAEASF